MFLVGIFQWWYGAGWRRHMQRVGLGVLRTADFFSIGLLVRTLFDPFRQISAGQVRAQAPLAVKMQAFFDRLFSRAVGAVVRLLVLFTGLVVISLRVVWAVGSIVVWALLPVTPVIGIILWQMRILA